MGRASKRILLIACGGALLLALAGLVVLLTADLNRYKSRIEAAATDALGMDVRIGGRLSLGFFPEFRVTIEDGRILSAPGIAVVSAERLSLGIELIPLLRRQVRLRRVVVTRPTFSLERDRDGRSNVERLERAVSLLAALDGARISMSGGTLRYADLRSGAGFVATGIDVAVKRLAFAEGRGPRFLKGVALEGELGCEEIRTKSLVLSALRIPIAGAKGVFDLEPVTMQIFGGRGLGSLRADLSGPVPTGRMKFSVARFQIDEFLRNLSPKKAAEGAMDFSADLSMQGRTRDELIRSAAGEVSLRGANLTLLNNDLDRALSRFESSQNFNLVDVGAVFFAGPVGLAVTKGYNFASLFEGSGGSCSIRSLVSDWHVERGVARATDVAMATIKNRIALRGDLDFVNGRFADVTMAVIDSKGCAKVRQVIRGSFAKPEVEKPRVLTSLAGPVLRLVGRARGLFPAGPCETFYSGSVAPPR